MFVGKPALIPVLTILAVAVSGGPVSRAQECVDGQCEDLGAFLSSGGGVCSLFLAPSSIPGAGLGIFTGVDVPEGSPVGDPGDLFIPIVDMYKTMPYRGQQRFLSWLRYVWPKERHFFYHTWMDKAFPIIPEAFYADPGLSEADGLSFLDGAERLSAFAPGMASQVNSNPMLANIQMGSLQKDWAGLKFGNDVGVGAFTPHHGVSFSATQAIPAGSELFLNYGKKWHGNFRWRSESETEYETLKRFNKKLARKELPTEADKRQKLAKELKRQERRNKEGKKKANKPKTEKKRIEVSKEKQRVRVILGQTSGGLNATNVIALDIPKSYTMKQVLETLHRLHIPRTFWDVARVELEGPAVRQEALKSGRDLQQVRIQHDNKVADVLGDSHYLVVIPSNDSDQKVDMPTQKKKENVDRVSSTLNSSTKVDWLLENGMCLDNIRSGPSSVPQAGRGAFAKNFISKGSVIAPAPLLVLKREDLVIYRSDDIEGTFRDALDFDDVVGRELLLNYCFGHPESELLLVPYSPVVNFINHNGKEPNAEIKWPERSLIRSPQDWLGLHPIDVLDQSGQLMMEFVALRDIAPGEEIFINYGKDWENAWNTYTAEMLNEDLVFGAFRHEIEVPEGFFPEAWINKSVVYEIAQPEAPLKPGELFPLTWAHNGKPVAKHAWIVGLPEGFSAHMRNFSDERGITALCEKLLFEDTLESDEWFVFDVPQGEQWFAQRYKSTHWNFNMHYVAAWDEAARVSFLRSMGTGGFDQVLEGMGTTLGYDTLTCFHASFMGISEADNSFTHADIYATGEKGLNIIWPLIVVNGSKPELDIHSDDANVMISVKYEYDMAFVLGDWGYHKTSAIDYGESGQIRLVVGSYCAQIDASNARMMHHLYDGEDPAPFADQFELPLKEIHWAKPRSLLDL